MSNNEEDKKETEKSTTSKKKTATKSATSKKKTSKKKASKKKVTKKKTSKKTATKKKDDLNPLNPDWPKFAVDGYYSDRYKQVVFMDKHGILRNKKGRYLPGQSGNYKGVSSKIRNLRDEIRNMSAEMMLEEGMGKLRAALRKKNLTVWELTAIINILTPIIFPKPRATTAKERREQAEENREKLGIPQIVIDEKTYNRARQADHDYLHKIYEGEIDASDDAYLEEDDESSTG